MLAMSPVHKFHLNTATTIVECMEDLDVLKSVFRQFSCCTKLFSYQYFI